MEDRPERIEAEIFPFKFQKVDVEKMLTDLAKCPQKFIVRYEKNSQRYIQIPSFLAHQHPHPREIDSTIPGMTKAMPRHGRARLNPDVLNPESPLSDSASRSLAKVVSKDQREYRIPEPKEDPTGAIVMYYKAVKKGIPYDDRSWDKQHWPRSAKAASDVLKICGSYEAARACVDHVVDDMVRAGRTWTLETVLRWAHEWKSKQGGKDYGATNSARFFGAVAKQRSEAQFENLRKLSSPGEVLDSLRDMPKLPHQTGEGHNGTAGKPDGGAVAGVRETALEATPDRGQAS